MTYYLHTDGNQALKVNDDQTAIQTTITYLPDNAGQSGLVILILDKAEITEDWVESDQQDYLDFIAIPKITGLFEQLSVN